MSSAIGTWREPTLIDGIGTLCYLWEFNILTFTQRKYLHREIFYKMRAKGGTEDPAAKEILFGQGG